MANRHWAGQRWWSYVCSKQMQPQKQTAAKQHKNTGANTTIKKRGDTKKNNNKSLSTSVEEVWSTKAIVISMPVWSTLGFCKKKLGIYVLYQEWQSAGLPEMTNPRGGIYSYSLSQTWHVLRGLGGIITEKKARNTKVQLGWWDLNCKGISFLKLLDLKAP